jgi:hypothetical protein
MSPSVKRKISQLPISLSVLLLLFLLHGSILDQSFVIGGIILQGHNLPVCDGPAPPNWGLALSSMTCPPWTPEIAMSACHTGFGASNWRCNHWNCHCSYDKAGVSSILCFRASWTVYVRPHVSFAEYKEHQTQFEADVPLGSYCQAACQCPPLAGNMLEMIRLEAELARQKSDPSGGAEILDENLKDSSSNLGFSSGSACSSGQCQSDTCSVDCRGPRICHEARAAGCAVNRCRANQLPQDSRSSFAAWGSCVQTFASSIGGRDVLPCACNSTYVSLACCGSDDGEVWEDERFALGRLEDL